MFHKNLYKAKLDSWGHEEIYTTFHSHCNELLSFYMQYKGS